MYLQKDKNVTLPLREFVLCMLLFRSLILNSSLRYFDFDNADCTDEDKIASYLSGPSDTFNFHRRLTENCSDYNEHIAAVYHICHDRGIEMNKVAMLSFIVLNTFECD